MSSRPRQDSVTLILLSFRARLSESVAFFFFFVFTFSLQDFQAALLEDTRTSSRLDDSGSAWRLALGGLPGSTWDDRLKLSFENLAWHSLTIIVVLTQGLHSEC